MSANPDLMRLSVARDRLASTISAADALVAIEEIVISVLGSEMFGVYEVDPAGATLHLVSSMGIDTRRHRTISMGAGIIGRVAATRTMHVEEHGDTVRLLRLVDPVVACVPLECDGTMRGVLAVFELLRHKSGLDSVDRALLRLLGAQGGRALQSRHDDRREATRQLRVR